MKKSNTPFFAFVAVVIIGASFAFSWKQVLPNFVKTNKAIKAAESESAAASAKLDSLVKVKGDLDSVGDLVDSLFIAVPQDADTPNLYTELEALFTNQKFAVPNIQISDASGSAVSISFSVDGTFEQLNALLAVIESDIRFMNIKSVSFSTSSDGKLSMSLQIEAYKRAAVSAATPGAATSAATPAVNPAGVQ